MLCYFVSDIHGSVERYDKLFARIRDEKPDVVFWGGDLLPHGYTTGVNGRHDFINDFLFPKFTEAKKDLGDEYPRMFIIFGNDDGRHAEEFFKNVEKDSYWEYIHFKKTKLDKYDIYGYSYVPPTPFKLKDWERYDTDFTLRKGCVAPETGLFTTDINKEKIKTRTITGDLAELTNNASLSKAIMMIHTPPSMTNLDRIGWPGMPDNLPDDDVHVGSRAVRDMIEKKQPHIVLCGHIHESPRLTGSWSDKIGKTYCFSAAHDSPELSIVKFDPENPDQAQRELL